MMAIAVRRHAPSLKMLHWKKVPTGKLHNTLWEASSKLGGRNVPELDKKEMELLLCEDPKAKKNDRKKKKKVQESSNKQVILYKSETLDPVPKTPTPNTLKP